MRATFVVITLAACSTKTVQSEIKAHKPRLEAVLDTYDLAAGRSDNEMGSDMVDIDVSGSGVPVPALPAELRRTPPLAVIPAYGRPDEETPLGRCLKLIESVGLDETKAASMTVSEVTTTLKACDVHYIAVIERDDDAGREEYVDPNVGAPMGRLSKGGIFEIFDTTDKKRIVTVKFLVHEPPPASIDVTSDIDHERLYRAADAAFKKLVAASAKPSH